MGRGFDSRHLHQYVMELHAQCQNRPNTHHFGCERANFLRIVSKSEILGHIYSMNSVTLDSKTAFDEAVARAQEAAKAYYTSDSTTMTDAEYDALLDAIEEAHLVHPDWDDKGLIDKVAGGAVEASDQIERGFAPEEASKWRNTGFAFAEAQRWIRDGFTPDEARKWSDAGFNDARVANEWRRYPFTPDEAIKWSKTGIDLESAYNLHKAGFVPGEEWKAVGISPEDAERWKHRFLYEFAVMWHAQGFTPDEAKEWRKHGFQPEEARQWRDYDFSPEEAVEWINDPKRAR